MWASLVRKLSPERRVAYNPSALDPGRDLGGGLVRLPPYLLVRHLVAGREVLDLGCADGVGAALLARAGARVLAWDPQGAVPEQLQSVGGRLPRLELPTGSLDAVLCVGLLDRLPASRHEECVREIARLLRPDGWAVVSVARPGPVSYGRLAGLVRPVGRAALLGQVPMAGAYLSFLEPPLAAEELAFCGDIVETMEPDEPSHYVAVVAPGALPDLHPYLLVTLPHARYATELGAGDRQADGEARRLREELARQTARVGERDAEILRLAGRTARIERLEAELDAAQESAAELERLRGAHQELRLSLGREEAAAAGLRRELVDARAALDDLERQAQEAEQAAIELALARDEAEVRRARLHEGYRELRGEFQRLKGQFVEAQQELQSRRQEAMSFAVSLDRATTEVTRLREQTERMRAELDEARAEADELAGALSEREARITELVEERDGFRRELSAGEVQRQGIEEERDALREELDRLSAEEQERAARGEELVELRGLLEAREQELERSRAELTAALEERAALEQALEQSRAELTAAALEERAELTAALEERSGLEQALEQSRSELTAALEERSGLEQALERSRSELTAALEERGQLQQELDRGGAGLAERDAALAEQEERLVGLAKELEQVRLAGEQKLLEREMEIEVRVTEQAQAVRRINELEAALRDATRRASAAKEATALLEQERTTRTKQEQELKTLRTGQSEAERRLEEMRKQLEEEIGRSFALQDEVARTRKEAASLRTQLEQAQAPEKSEPSEEWKHSEITRPREEGWNDIVTDADGEVKLKPDAQLVEASDEVDHDEETLTERKDDLADIKKMVDALVKDE